MKTLGVRTQLGNPSSNSSFGSSWLLCISLLLKNTFTWCCVPTQLLPKLTNLRTAYSTTLNWKISSGLGVLQDQKPPSRKEWDETEHSGPYTLCKALSTWEALAAAALLPHQRHHLCIQTQLHGVSGLEICTELKLALNVCGTFQVVRSTPVIW